VIKNNNKTSKTKIFLKKAFIFCFVVFVFFFASKIYATESYVPGETIVIGEFIYNDDYTPTTDDCTISIYNPSGSVEVNEATMIDDSTGWHQYSFVAPIIQGKYPTFITCGTLLGGDLLKLDKTFIVKEPIVTDSSIASSVWSSASRTLTSFGSLVSDIWSNGSRTLTSIGSLASDIWNDAFAPTRTLTSKNIAGGGSLATESYIDASEATIVSEVQSTQDLITALNNITASDVWSYGARSLNSDVDISTASVDEIWDIASSGLDTSGSVGKLIVNNLDTQVSSRGTSNLTAADVWSAATRTLSDYNTLDVANAVWSNGTRTLTSYGNDITALDVWNVLSSSLITVGSIGNQLATNIDEKSSTILTEVQSNAALITSLNNISANDIWSYAGRSLDSTVDISPSSEQEIWDVASSNLSTSGSIGKLLVDNIDAQISTRGISNLTATDVWSAATRTLTDYSDSAIASAVWASATRTLTSYGNDITALDVWNVLSSSLITVGSIGEQIKTNLDTAVSSVGGNWSVKMGNIERVQAGYIYRTKVFILDKNSDPITPFAFPVITIYDTNRNIVVSGISMAEISMGVYEYTYSVANSAVQGLWETVVRTEVESGKIITNNDYWEVSGSPAQVIINSIKANNLNSISGNVTITNEGLSGYEYNYEWCIVSNLNNECGGNDDTFYSSAAKYINPGDSWNTNLTASVSTPGTYYFKLVVYFGTDSSGASRVFSVSSSSGGGGGGGGGGSSMTEIKSCNGADFNINGKVDSTDFSILLYFWKTLYPFKNKCVDINVDQKVDSIDFSIMLFQWGPKPI